MELLQSLIKRYFNLAYSISEHVPDYIDTYFGPGEWILPESERKGESLASVQSKAEKLRDDLQAINDIDMRRKTYLLAQIEAMISTVRILGGDELSLSEKVSSVLNVTPYKVPESEFLEVHRELDTLLPPGGTLWERVRSHIEQMIVPKEKAEDVYEAVIADLQRWTNELYDLPSDERYDLKFVYDKPWSGFSQYQGNGLSNIEINVDLPISIMRLIELMAHEIYPGHHTENSIKEMKLIHGAGKEELYIILTLSPACVVNEGIATHAPEIILDEEKFADWLETKILPVAGLRHLDARRLVAINSAHYKIWGVGTNAAFMFWDEGLKGEDIKEYCLEYLLLSEEYADNFVNNWLPHPLFHIYSFTYLHGYRLLERLFDETGDAHFWFGQLLEQAYLPDQVEELGERNR